MTKASDRKREEERYSRRLGRHLDELKWLYMELYDSQEYWEELLAAMKQFAMQRKSSLKKLDETREQDPGWYRSSGMLGMMLYVDQFAGTLKGVQEKLDYIRRCRVNYLHLMPLLESPKGRSDGGYAVADFRKVRPDLGTWNGWQPPATDGESACAWILS